jgi:hypothetical protein
MSGAPRLMALLMYGAGLRLLECCSLRIHDVDRGAGWVELPWALGPKYPNAGREWGWQWVFPASRFNVEPASRQTRVDTISMNLWSSGPYARRCSKPASSSGQRVIRSATRSQRTCWRMATTSGPYRSRSGAASQHHDDLYARPQPRSGGGAKPGGPGSSCQSVRRRTRTSDERQRATPNSRMNLTGGQQAAASGSMAWRWPPAGYPERSGACESKE